MKLTLDIPASQDKAVLAAFADQDGTSGQKVVEHKLLLLVAQAVATREQAIASRDAGEKARGKVCEAFGVDIPVPRQRGSERAQQRRSV